MAFGDFLNKYVLADGQPSQPAAAKPAQGVPGAAQMVSPSMTANNEFVTALRNAIKGRATAFTALLQAADKLAGIIPDPNTRLKAAFATVQGEGRGLKEVVGAIEVHMSDLEGQRAQFTAAMEKQKSQALGTLQGELQGLQPANENAQRQIASMSEQIQQLQALIGKNSARAGELQGQINAEGARFSTSQQEFETALTIVKSELEGQKTAVLSTLS